MIKGRSTLFVKVVFWSKSIREQNRRIAPQRSDIDPYATRTYYTCSTCLVAIIAPGPMFSQQYQVPDWELQLQGLIARNSTIREASPTSTSCHFSQPHPHQHWDMPNAVSPTSASQLKSMSQSSKQQSRTDRTLSMVREEVKRQGNVLDIVRGQFAAFSDEFNSNRLAAETIDAKMSSLGHLLKSLQTEESTTKMHLKAAASEITILQRQQSETKELTASLFRQMQQELSDLKANVQVLRDENALMKEQLDAVGVNQPIACSPSVTLNDRIETIVAAAVATHSSELERATTQTIQAFESNNMKQNAAIAKSMDALEQRLTAVVDNALDIVNKDIIHLSQAKESTKENETMAQLENDLSDRMDSLYGRQNILDEQMYERSSATKSVDPLCSTHDANDLLSGDGEQNLAEEMPSKSMSDSSADHVVVTTDIAPLSFIERSNNLASINSTSLEQAPSPRKGGAIHQAPEWLHGAVIEELKNKFTQEQEHRDTN